MLNVLSLLILPKEQFCKFDTAQNETDICKPEKLSHLFDIKQELNLHQHMTMGS